MVNSQFIPALQTCALNNSHSYYIGRSDNPDTNCSNFKLAYLKNSTDSRDLIDINPSYPGMVTNNKPTFSAVLNTTTLPLTGAGQTATLVADQIIHQVGDSYDPQTGIFTAPVKGRYNFDCVIFTKGASVLKTAVGSIVHQTPSLERHYATNRDRKFGDHEQFISFEIQQHNLFMNPLDKVRCVLTAFLQNGAMMRFEGLATLPDATERIESRFSGYLIEQYN